MKKFTRITKLVFVGIALAVLSLSGCKRKLDQENIQISVVEKAIFTGTISSSSGKSLNNTIVRINNTESVSDSIGNFSLSVAQKASYLVNVEKPGFGLYSKKFHKAREGLKITLYEGTMTRVDPANPFQVTNIRIFPQQCVTPISSNIDWSAFPNQAIPHLFSGDGRYLGQEVSQEVRNVIDYITNTPPCSPGISIAVPSNALIDKDGNKPEGKVDVSLTTVDLFAPDAMPGDYTVRTKEGEVYMQSFGAGSVQLTNGNNEYQLNEKSTAEITIPIAPSSIVFAKELEDSIPLLVYDQEAGVWLEDGFGYLNRKRDAYIAELKHFSTFNMDALKVNQSCIRINSEGINGAFDLEVAWQEDGSVITRNLEILNEPGDNLHAIYNLPNNTDVIFRPFKEGNFGPVPLGTFVVNSGPPQDPTDPNRPVYPYCACQAELFLTENFDVPILVGPIHDVFGDFELTAFYTWPTGTTAPDDGYELDESSVSGSWPTPTDPIIANTDPSNTWSISKAPGTYYYRSRVMENSIYSNYSNVIQVNVVDRLETVLKIVNNIKKSNEVNTVVRLRIGSSPSEVLNNATLELLEPDNYCEADIGKDIGPGESAEFDVSSHGPDYYVTICMGDWIEGSTTCPDGYSKTYMDSDNNYTYCVLEINGHFSDLYEILITSDDTGQLSANGIPFIELASDPFY